MRRSDSGAVAFRCCLAVMAGPAQALQITFHIGSPMSLGCDVVDCLRLDCPTFTQTLLAQVFIPAQHHSTQTVPLRSVSAFVSALALLVVFPTGVPVFFAVSAAVGSCLCAASFAAGAGDS